MQLDLLSWQPPPELMEASQSSTPFRVGQRVIADGKAGSVYHDDGGAYVWVAVGNTATPHDRHTVQPASAEKPVINQPAIAWQEGQIAYYRKLMLRFMELSRLDAGTATPQKQAMRRHMISVLHSRCKVCLVKIEQLQGGE